MTNQNSNATHDVALDSSITRSELVETLSAKFPQLLPKDVELVVKTLLRRHDECTS
jgi:integration host factor subunit beta